jgi:G-patch domain
MNVKLSSTCKKLPTRCLRVVCFTMSADEDDYLSDKFLTEAGSISSAPKTYAQIRKEAVKKAQLKNEQNRLKGRRQREVEAREEGLSKSLFERAKEEEDAGIGGNKALSMMMKMGFKPGQSLGQLEETTKELPEPSRAESDSDGSKTPPLREEHSIHERGPRHKIEPLPLNEWAGALLFHCHRISSTDGFVLSLGKKGIGLGKRAKSPTAAERVAKMAKMGEETSHRDYRDRARQEYEDRRAEGRLGPFRYPLLLNSFLTSTARPCTAHVCHFRRTSGEIS